MIENQRREVEVVHAAVSGRTRLRVRGLRYGNKMKQLLESNLLDGLKIRYINANVTTGTVLVYHAAELNSDLIRDEIQSFLVDLKSPAKKGKLALTFARRKSDRKTQSTRGVSWHAMEVADVLKEMGITRKNGLPSSVAKDRLKVGANVLKTRQKPSGMSIFIDQFKSLPTILLTGSAVISVATGGAAEAVVLLVVVMANSYVGYKTESLAEHTISLLGNMKPQLVTVVRDGKQVQIPTEQLVQGDLVALTAGVVVPADGRIVKSQDLSVDESALTGEGVPVEKSHLKIDRESLPLADRINMLYRGTVITSGTALMVNTATGQNTEIGKIQNLVEGMPKGITVMQRQLDDLTRRLVYMGAGLGVCIFVVKLLRGIGFLDILQTSVSVIVAAIPEGLTTVHTVTLSQNLMRMQRRKVLARNLQAVENLGAVSVICLDKTGTITKNQMQVSRVSTAGDTFKCRDSGFVNVELEKMDAGVIEIRRIAEISSLCSEVKIVKGGYGKSDLDGSPTEKALVRLSELCGMNIEQLRSEHPAVALNLRTEDQRYMTSIHKMPNGKTLIAVKGSPDEVLGLSSDYLFKGKAYALDSEMRLKIKTENDLMGWDALRVLGFAFAEVEDYQEDLVFPKLTWLGLVGMADSAREGVKELLHRLRSAGVRPIMITGDQKATAAAIAREVDLTPGQLPIVFDYSEREKMTAEAVERLSHEASVFARVSPGEKLDIVQALQKNGAIAMVGDGINDAPALAAADVGIAMGLRGTEVAREVADVVLLDDNLEKILSAIELGRGTHEGIKKAVTFSLSTNSSECFLMLGSIILGTGIPLSPLQLLWINLVTDILPALSLAVEPPEADVLSQPPRNSKDPILSSADFKVVAMESGVMTAAAFATYLRGVSKYGMGAQAQSMAFLNLSTSQLLHAISSRSDTHTIFSRGEMPKNKYLPAAIGGSFALQMAAIAIPPVRRALGVAPISTSDLVISAGTSFVSFLTNEVFKQNRNHNSTIKNQYRLGG